MVETDAPYLAPVPKRGRENKTAYTRYVVDFIAGLRGLTTEEVAQATYDNARRYLALTEKRKIPEVIVVEGKDDTANLRRFMRWIPMKREALRLIKMTWNELLPCKSCVGSLSLPIQTTMASEFARSLCKRCPRPNMPFKSWRGGAQNPRPRGVPWEWSMRTFEDLEKALAGLVGSYEDENFFDITKTDLMRLDC